MSSPLGIPGLQQPEVIGRGGFGTVYRVTEPEFGRDVAVKVIQDRLEDEDVRRAFVRECRAMGTLSGHPHIVTVHRGGTTDHGEPYIVMDLMAAGSLADRLAEQGVLPWTEVLDIGVAVAGALETAHRAGILHLDVKPANVLMSRYGEPKLADFGISRLPGVTATTDGRIRASIAYAAPERLLDGTALPASDLYALGATLYTLLSGHAAFATRSGEDLMGAIARIVREPVPDLREQGVPDALAHVVERLMAKSPLDRFATASDAAFALQAAQRATGRPVTKAVVEGAAPSRADATTGQLVPPGRWVLGTAAPPERMPRPSYVPQRRQPTPTRVQTPPGAPWLDPAGAASAAEPAGAGRWTPDNRSARPAGAEATLVDRVTPAPPVLPSRPGTPDRPLAPDHRESPDHRGTPARPAVPDGLPPPGPPAGRTLVAEPGSMPSSAPAPARRRGRLLAGAAIVTVLALGAGGGALLVDRSAAPPDPDPPVPTAAGPATPTPTSTTTASPPPLPVADGVTHPERDAIAARLGSYFQAINDHDFEKAFGYFSPDSAVVGNGYDTFREGNSTTVVQRQRILAITDLPGDAVTATVTYRSTQDAEFGPSGETCTNWRLSYEMVGPDRLIRRARVLADPQAC
ncbi:MAG TPA: protein kinase [Pseudonocardia sp.]|nr:protein kinase [Pseudonocardia sp.]